MPGQVRLGSGTFGFPGDVTSVFGRVGAVVAQTGDYSFAQLSGKPSTLAGYGITDAVATTDTRLTNDRTANAIRTGSLNGIGTGVAAGNSDVFALKGGAWQPCARAVYQGNVTNPAGTTVAGGAMMGIGGLMTPSFSPNIHFTCCGKVKNNTAGAGALIILRHGITAKPSNGDGVTGTAIGGQAGFSGAGYAANQEVSFSLSAVINNAAIGTAHWFDVSLAAVGGGTAQILLTAITAFEF